MATTNEWTYKWVAYYAILAVIVFLGTALMQSNELVKTGGYQVNAAVVSVVNQTTTPEYSAVPWDWGDYIKDVFSILIFNISINTENSVIMEYLWLFRMIFIYLPTLYLTITLYFAVRSGSA